MNHAKGMHEADIQELLSDCRSGSPERQMQALLKLVELHATIAIPSLMDLLASPDDVIRAESAQALGKLGQAEPEKVGPAITKLLEDQEEYVRSEAVEALGTLKYQPAGAAVGHILRTDPSWVVRCSAAEVLAYFGDQAAMPDLEAVLQDANASVRSYAAGTLGILAPPAFLATLEAYLIKEPSSTVKRQLLVAGYRLGATKNMQDLLDSLHTVTDEDSASITLKIFQDLAEWNPPVSLKQDAPRLRPELATLAQRFPLLQAYAACIINNLNRPRER